MDFDFKQLQALATVIDEQGFDKAAQKLCLTQSAISQRVRQLEIQIGHILIIRSSPPQLTETGHQVMMFYRQLALLHSEFAAMVPGSSENNWNTLSIGTNADSLCTWLLDALGPLLQSHRLVLDLKIDDQEQTHELLRKGEVMGCISARSVAEKGCNCMPLGVMRYRCLVSPDFYQRYFATGVTQEAIVEAPCVEFSSKDELILRYLRRVFQIDSHPKIHRIPLTDAYMGFISKGNAWGIVPDQQSEQARAEGSLIELLPNKPIDVPLYWHIWNLKSQVSQALSAQLQKSAQTILLPM
ncbi:MAG: LysR family transcriptional regulator ArgP [Hahellaceae bacterium]|nr:LysR family transcriptional regulator ArgP [Hahellaceae bacterium]MCP5209686.1 LysR family transcriptional regulator ArgP [Hahellaceae bacterium]